MSQIDQFKNCSYLKEPCGTTSQKIQMSTYNEGDDLTQDKATYHSNQSFSQPKVKNPDKFSCKKFEQIIITSNISAIKWGKQFQIVKN